MTARWVQLTPGEGCSGDQPYTREGNCLHVRWLLVERQPRLAAALNEVVEDMTCRS